MPSPNPVAPPPQSRLSESEAPIARDVEAASAVVPGTDLVARPERKALPPTTKLTGRQFFYIFIVDGLGAMVLSGGINFAIAYAMYTTQDTVRHPIRLFQLPNTLAGDAAVTIIVQCLITWFIEWLLVRRDLAGGHLAPIGFLRRPSGRLARWYFFLDDDNDVPDAAGDGGEADAPPAAANGEHRAKAAALPLHQASPGSTAREVVLFVLSQALRAFLVAVAAFVLFWGPSVGILTAVGTRSGGDWVFHKTWAPQLFKLVLGGLLALVTTPPFAMFWMARAGWAAEGLDGR